MKIIYKSILIFLFFLFTNCASKKKFVYFQDTNDKKITTEYLIKLKVGDILSIKIFGCDEESIKIFHRTNEILLVEVYLNESILR